MKEGKGKECESREQRETKGTVVYISFPFWVISFLGICKKAVFKRCCLKMFLNNKIFFPLSFVECFLMPLFILFVILFYFLCTCFLAFFAFIYLFFYDVNSTIIHFILCIKLYKIKYIKTITVINLFNTSHF